MLGASILVDPDLSDNDYEKLFEDDTIEDLSTAISSSNTLSDNAPMIVEELLSEFSGSATIEVPAVEYKGPAGKTEIEGLLRSMENLRRFGLETPEEFAALDKDDIDEISTNFSNSKIIRHNLSAILVEATTGTDFELESDEDEDFWTKDEIYNTLLGASILVDPDLSDNDYEKLFEDDTIEDLSTAISSSNTLSDNAPMIVEELLSEFSGSATIEVPAVEYKGPAGKTEIEGLLRSMENLRRFGLETPEEFAALDKDDIDEISTNFSNSKIIRHNLSAILVEATTGTDFELESDEDEDFWTKDEIYNTLLGASILVDPDLSDNDYEKLFEDDTIEDLSTAISSSNTLSDNAPMIVEELLSEFSGSATIEVPAVEYKGPAGKTEIEGLLRSMENLRRFGLETPEEFAALDKDDIDEISTNFSNSKIIRHNLSAIITEAVKNSEFEFVSDEDEDFWTKDEIYNTFYGVSILMDPANSANNYQGLLAGDDEDNETIDDLSEAISKSQTLSGNADNLIEKVMNGFNASLVITMPTAPKVTYEGEPGKEELQALLYSALHINQSGLLDSSDAIGDMSDGEIGKMSARFASSRIIKHNLSEIINVSVAGSSFDFVSSDKEESFWTEEEIYNTFIATKTLKNAGIDDTNIHTLSPANVHLIALSHTISESIEALLVNKTKPGASLDGILIIPDNLVYYSTDEDIGEIELLFAGLKELIGVNSLDSFDPDVDQVLEKDIDVVFKSDILEATLVENQIKPLFSKDGFKEYFVSKYQNDDEFVWYKTVKDPKPDGDTVELIKAFRDLSALGIDYNGISYDDFLTALQSDPDNVENINDILISSNIIRASLGKMFNQLLNVDENDFGIDVYNGPDLDYWGTKDTKGELYNILNAMMAADSMRNYDYDNLDINNAAGFKADAKEINKSATFRQLLPRILTDSPLTIADPLRTPVDPADLSKEDWDNEIDVLVDIIIIINSQPGIDLMNPQPTHFAAVYVIAALMDESILYDKSLIPII